MLPPRIPFVPSSITGEIARYLTEVARRLNAEPILSIFSGSSPESVVTGIPGNVTVNIGVSDVDRVFVMSGTTARQKKTGWTAITGGSRRQNISLMAGDNAQPWTSMPLALTEFDGAVRNRMMATLTDAISARIGVCMTASGSTNAEIRAQYSVNQGAAWSYLDGSAGPTVSIHTSNFTVGSWVSLAAGAQADVWLRPVGIGGDGVVTPSFGNITLEVE